MGLYNFKSQFVPFILDGSKTHTIRAPRKNLAKPGETLHLYTGLRQPGAELLMRAPCIRVESIVIWVDGAVFIGPVGPMNPYLLHNPSRASLVRLDDHERDLLAWRDGFRVPLLGRAPNRTPGSGGHFNLMMKFWDGRLPFAGHIIHWDYAKREEVGAGEETEAVSSLATGNTKAD